MDAANLMVNTQPKINAKTNNIVKNDNAVDKKTSKSDGGAGKQGQSFGTVFEQAVNTVADDKDEVATEATAGIAALSLLPGNNQAAILLQLSAQAQQLSSTGGITEAGVTTNGATATLLQNAETIDLTALTNPDGTVAKGADSLAGALQGDAKVGASAEMLTNPVSKNTFADMLLDKQVPQAPTATVLSAGQAEIIEANGLKIMINTNATVSPETTAKAMLNALGSDSAVMANAAQVSSSNALNKSELTTAPPANANQLPNVAVVQADNKNANSGFSSSDGQNLSNQLLNQPPEQTGQRNEPANAFSQKLMPALSETSVNSSLNTGAEIAPLQPETKSTSSSQPQFFTNVMDIRNNIVNAPATSSNAGVPTQDYQIPQQIVDQAKLIKTTEDTQMIIKLKPEHLGDLALKISVENGIVSASFHSDNAQVRAMIETSLIQLKQELAAQGIKVDNVGVYSGMGDLLSNGQQQAGRDQQNPRYKNRKIDMSEFADDVDKIAPVTANAAGDTGVDYRI